MPRPQPMELFGPRTSTRTPPRFNRLIPLQPKDVGRGFRSRIAESIMERTNAFLAAGASGRIVSCLASPSWLRLPFCWRTALLALLAAGGCASPYHTDRGALFGGAAGAGVGALVGEAVGHPGVGALVGAGVGTLSGAAVGSSLDEMEARNRAMIAAQLGRQVPRGAVTMNDAIEMTRQGLDDDLIVNHIRYNGVAQRPQAQDLIALQKNGVSKQVIEAMQTATPPPQAAPAMAAAPPPVMVAPPPVWGPPPPYYYYYPPPPPVWGFGMSFR